jgi:hypothetical protein
MKHYNLIVEYEKGSKVDYSLGWGLRSVDDLSKRLTEFQSTFKKQTPVSIILEQWSKEDKEIRLTEYLFNQTNVISIWNFVKLGILTPNILNSMILTITVK